MYHKIYSFDFDFFKVEFSDILNNALINEETSALEQFIVENLSHLYEPWEGGEKLNPDWQDLLESRNVHAFGDFGLTKYYNIQYEGGLFSDYLRISEKIKDQSLVLGKSFGPEFNMFDPGKMGSYFLSNSELRMNLDRLKSKEVLKEKLNGEENKTFGDYLNFMENTFSKGKGLYITF